MVQIPGHALKNWLIIMHCMIIHGMDGLASQSKQCTGPSPFVV